MWNARQPVFAIIFASQPFGQTESKIDGCSADTILLAILSVERIDQQFPGRFIADAKPNIRTLSRQVQFDGHHRRGLGKGNRRIVRSKSDNTLIAHRFRFDKDFVIVGRLSVGQHFEVPSQFLRIGAKDRRTRGLEPA